MSEEKDCIDKIDDFWNTHKNSISSKFSIGLGVMGGVGSILVGMKLFIPTSIVLGICNVGIFFSGIAMQKYAQENTKLSDEKISLHNEKQEIIRRYTTIQHGGNNEPLSITPTDSIDTIQPVQFESMHQNNMVESSMNNFAFPKE